MVPSLNGVGPLVSMSIYVFMSGLSSVADSCADPIVLPIFRIHLQNRDKVPHIAPSSHRTSEYAVNDEP